jgi:hypothetical protein
MGRRPMTALLLGLGALLLAVAAGARLDPRPSHTDRADDQMPRWMKSCSQPDAAAIAREVGR